MELMENFHDTTASTRTITTFDMSPPDALPHYGSAMNHCVCVSISVLGSNCAGLLGNVALNQDSTLDGLEAAVKTFKSRDPTKHSFWQ